MNRFVAYLSLLTAISIAGVAAWFSIIGLMAIFSAAAIKIAIMGAVLEVGKLVTASLLYRNWDKLKYSLKIPLTLAVIALMFITSMGIFGLLSKGYLEQHAPVGNNVAMIERLERSIVQEERQIRDAETVLAQLDGAVQTLTDYDRISGPSGAIAVRRSQQEERNDLTAIISNSQKRITELEDEIFPLASQIREIEMEVGPVKYIAELVYGADADLDSAVRLVILIIVFAFDPLAVLLLLAANHALLDVQKKVNIEVKEETITITDDDSPHKMSVKSHMEDSVFGPKLKNKR